MSNSNNKPLELFRTEEQSKLYITISDSPVHAGFPSPADDHLENKLDLNKALVKNPATTFFARVKGESMNGEGVEDGDMLIIDKSLDPYENCLAVCFLEGEFTLKRVKLDGDNILLIPSNPKFKTIRVSRDNDFYIWGIVKYLIKKM
ncbi:MAG: translesion error-prone DNA polymerase V autoproteolytic subunit [Bacteroidales bacterium]|jgi:DNA polymerase V|nr:translesion error-prone DNA polymerase V autoproteolytic subunit [Bacteroidales bacterium]